MLWATVKGLPFLILLALLVRVAIRREHRWVRDTLADDVAAGLVTNEELDALGDLRRRRAVRKAVGLRKGVDGERLMARLQHAQVELAVAESGSAPDREVRLAADRERIRGLRTQLDGLPDVATARPGVAPAGAPVGRAAPPTPRLPFAATHLVPPEGLPSWAIPDPAGPATALGGGLEIEVVRRVSDWAEVRASNGWSGWVDGRRLVPR